METSALIRRTGLGLAGSALAMSLMVAAARAGELAPGEAGPSGAAGIVIHDAAETLRDHCRFEDGAWWFRLPGGSRFELVTSTADPAIANPGDGSFHPFDAAEVRAALDAVRYPLGGSGCEIWILPYPRRASLESAAGPGLVLLSPAVLPIPRERQHAEVVHELGHVVHHARMPDDDASSWERYRLLRGIADAAAFSAEASHANRPHEIFAEDFRALFGGALATTSGTIENASLAPPQSVPGLESFLLELAGVAPAAAPFAAWPNPSSGTVRIAFAGARAGAVAGADLAVDVFDAGGRRVATLEPVSRGGSPAWEWDGRTAGGGTAPPGTYFAFARAGWGTVKLVRVR
jgi:hypothetical protein